MTRRMRITKVYTRVGDGGETRLGGGQSVRKDSARIAAFGTVDELNSQLGVAVAVGLVPVHEAVVRRVQHELFRAGSQLCMLDEDRKKYSVPEIEQRHIDGLEKDIDRLLEPLPPLEEFILPGGTAGAAQLHVARTVCRRAERLVVALAREEEVGSAVIAYLNRLSDLLFVVARAENAENGREDPQWDREV